MSGRNLLALRGLSRSEILKFLDHALFLKQIEPEKLKFRLAGKTVALLFFEASTRTRLSFELAASRLGARVLTFPVEASSLLKGESLTDTARNVEALGADLLVIRHPYSGGIYPLAQKLSVPVVNAGDGCCEHPTQALLDMFTIREAWGKLAGLEVVVAGDIQYSRVARSLLWGLRAAADTSLTFAGPPTLLSRNFSSLGVRLSWSLDEVIPRADVLYLLRIQKERQERGLIPSLTEYARVYGLTPERLRMLKRGAVIMHPGPVNVGIEISDRALCLIEESRERNVKELIQQQIANGVIVRMAVLDLILKGGGGCEANDS